MLFIKSAATSDLPTFPVDRARTSRRFPAWFGRHAHLFHVTECLLCRQATNGSAVCGTCLQGLGRARVQPAGRCKRCFLRLSSEGAHCSFCDDRNVFFDRHISLYQLTPAWREILHHWKFHNERRLFGLFRPALRRIFSDFNEMRIDSVCYIDSGRRSRRNRRYQPCIDPASYLAHIAGIPARAGLRKKKPTRQSEEVFNRRFFAVHDKIAINGYTGGAVQILLEDLWTTGATANEAARVLKKNGVRKVIVLSLLLREETF